MKKKLSPALLIAFALIFLVLVGLSSWASGWFGVAMAFLVAVIAGAILLNKTGILRLPAEAKSALGWVLAITLISIPAMGLTLWAYKEQKAVDAARANQVVLKHYHPTLYPESDPYTPEPGYHHIGMMYRANTGCMMAPSGFYFSQTEPDEFRSEPCDPGKKRCKEEVIEVRIQCAHDGAGVPSYAHDSNVFPTSMRVWSTVRSRVVGIEVNVLPFPQ